jgi:hypothetical protein
VCRESTLAEFYFTPSLLSADSAGAWKLKIISKPTGFGVPILYSWLRYTNSGFKVGELVLIS